MWGRVSFLAAAGRWAPWLATGMGSFAGVVAGMSLAAAVVWLVSQAARGGDPRREAFCRGALALVPWAWDVGGPLLFHLLMGVPGLLPLVQQAGQDFGLHWMSAPQWGATTSVLQGNGLLQLQLLFLDGGLLLSLYLAWRMVASTRVVRRLLAVAPLALFTVALYAFGFWLLLQPMQMRGVMMGEHVRHLIVALVLACAAVAAHADGGRLQMRQAAGPFVVSLFTTPESLAVGPATSA